MKKQEMKLNQFGYPDLHDFIYIGPPIILVKVPGVDMSKVIPSLPEYVREDCSKPETFPQKLNWMQKIWRRITFALQ